MIALYKKLENVMERIQEIDNFKLNNNFFNICSLTEAIQQVI